MRNDRGGWDDYSRELIRVLFVLKEYLPNIVLIGGCVPYIYWKHIYGAAVPPVYTTDLDVLIPNTIPVHARPIASLLDDAGFRGRVLELSHIQHFKFESVTVPGFEVEFRTPEPGGKRVETLVVQSGLRAQVLPGLRILLAHNMTVGITGQVEGRAVDLMVRVPTPGAFVLNKATSYLDTHGEPERAKDIYYVYYVLRYLALDKKALAESIRECAEPSEIRLLTSRLRPLFSDEFAPGVRDAAGQLSALEMTERNLRLLVLSEFEEFFTLLEA